MIEHVVPQEARASEAFGPDGAAVLYPEEAALVAAAPNERREEFTTVRGCARRALAALGLPPAPVLPGRRNAPRWPAGVVGSMTHCAGYRAAVLARDSDLTAVGIDAELHRPLPRGVLEATALPQELAWVRTPPAGAGPLHRDRVLFSAKEAVYKTWYPLVGTELDFEDAVIAFREDGPGAAAGGGPAAGARTGSFRARVLRPGAGPDGHPVSAFNGRWIVHRGLVVTAITVPARRSAGAADPAGGVPGR
ncbi:4'-phosphopantetheinyl transferase [Streptomyces sp. NRRL S-87]|uniref:4'-phosphopantetheinyl transferase family protein n=1 Tax=Streptomyces sp. NRRL S-87 TaxID=1463920 RepID=UPI0004BEBFAB|nr:4'-phosphopantetheinyl transferase superfamily protein [Streptomyces sp. NRRL S-87]